MYGRESLRTNIATLGFLERAKLQFTGFPKLLDTNRLTGVPKTIEKSGFAFTRAQLPQRYVYLNSQGNVFEDSRNVMVRITKNEAYSLQIVPGLHVVTGYDDAADLYDPLDRLLGILENGFHGGPTMNTYLLDPTDPQSIFKYGYTGNETTKKIVYSRRKEVAGDSYKLLLWSGFSSNYLSGGSEIGDQHGYGTARHTPQERIETYIFLAGASDPGQRTLYYRNQISDLPFVHPVHIIASGGKEVDIIAKGRRS